MPTTIEEIEEMEELLEIMKSFGLKIRGSSHLSRIRSFVFQKFLA